MKGCKLLVTGRMTGLVVAIAGSTVEAKLAPGRQWPPRPDFPDGDVQRDVVYKTIVSNITRFFDRHLKTGGSH